MYQQFNAYTRGQKFTIRDYKKQWFEKFNRYIKRVPDKQFTIKERENEIYEYIENPYLISLEI